MKGLRMGYWMKKQTTNNLCWCHSNKLKTAKIFEKKVVLENYVSREPLFCLNFTVSSWIYILNSFRRHTTVAQCYQIRLNTELIEITEFSLLLRKPDSAEEWEILKDRLKIKFKQYNLKCLKTLLRILSA